MKITLVQFTSLVPAQFKCSPSVVDCQDSSVVAVPSYSSSSVQLPWIVNLAVSWIPLYAPLYAASTSCVTMSQRLFSDVFTFSFHNILSDSFNGYIAKLCLPTFPWQIALYSPCRRLSVVGRRHVLLPLILPS